MATGVVAVSALYFARDVLIPITLAIFLSFLLAPIVRLLQRARLPKVVAVIVAVALALAVILLVGAIIGSQIRALVENYPEYVSTVSHKIELGSPRHQQPGHTGYEFVSARSTNSQPPRPVHPARSLQPNRFRLS